MEMPSYPNYVSRTPYIRRPVRIRGMGRWLEVLVSDMNKIMRPHRNHTKPFVNAAPILPVKYTLGETLPDQDNLRALSDRMAAKHLVAMLVPKRDFWDDYNHHIATGEMPPKPHIPHGGRLELIDGKEYIIY